jgi:hypothetical protein
MMTGKTMIGVTTGIMTGMVVSTMTPIAADISVCMTSRTLIHGLAIIGAGITDRTEAAIMIGMGGSIMIGMKTTNQ